MQIDTRQALSLNPHHRLVPLPNILLILLVPVIIDSSIYGWLAKVDSDVIISVVLIRSITLHINPISRFRIDEAYIALWTRAPVHVLDDSNRHSPRHRSARAREIRERGPHLRGRRIPTCPIHY
jgi:hypothetical protein